MRSNTVFRSAFGAALCLLVVAGNAHAQSLGWARQDGGTVGTPPPFNGPSVESAEGVAVDSLGNSYITGTFQGQATFGAGTPNQTVLTSFNGGQGIFVAKYDATGAFVWARGAGGILFFQDWAFDIAVDSAGNSYVTGFLAFGADFGGGITLTSPGAFVVKHDTNGNVVWATTLNPAAAAWAIAVDAGGNSFVAGGSGGSISANIAVWKVGPTGNLEWVRQTAGVHRGTGAGISVDTSGRIHVTGSFLGTVILGSGEPNQTILTNDLNGSPDLFVAQYEASGNLMWARQSLDAAGSAFGTGISTDSVGNSFLVGIGTTILGSGEANETAVTGAFNAKYDGLGNLVWARSVAPPFGQVSWIFAIASNSAGETYVTGTLIQGVIFIQKYGSSGDLLWSRRLAGVASVDALALQGNGISLDSAGNAYVAGQFSGTVRFGPEEPNETFLSTTSGNFDFDLFLAKYLNDTSVNEPPVADDQPVTTAEDTPVSITLTATDANGDPLTFEIVTPPAHGNLTGAPPTVIYTPHANYFGADRFTFRAFDGTTFSNEGTVSLKVLPVNAAPVANDQAVTTPEDTPVGVTLTGQDVDGDSLVFSVVTPPSHGTLSGTPPALTYTPDLDYVGPDSFTFRAFDGTVFSDPGRVSILVEPTSITCGGLVSGRIGAAAEVDVYRFGGRAGHIVSLALASTGGFASNRGTFSVELTLFAPTGAIIGRLRSNSQANFTLPEAGTYVIRVRASNLATTGSYNVNLECVFPTLSPPAIPSSCGALTSGTISAPGQVDLYSFPGQGGQTISLALASSGGFASNRGTFSVELTLFAPSGAAVASLRSNSQGNFTLPAPGTYVISVNATNLATTGSYTLTFACS
jgi:hypothetical protein